MIRIKKEKWQEFCDNAEEMGFINCSNYNRGENYQRKNIVFEYRKEPFYNGIIINGCWSNYEIGYLIPYVDDFNYPPIENYIQDLIQQGYVENVGDELNEKKIIRVIKKNINSKDKLELLFRRIKNERI